METVELKVQVPKELSEVGAAVVKLISVVKSVGKDGFSLTDIPAVIAEALVQLPPAIEGLEKVKGELSEDPVAAAKYAGVLAGDLLAVLK